MKTPGYADVLQILNLMKGSKFEEIRLEFGGFKIDLKRFASNAAPSLPPELPAKESKVRELTPVTAPMLGLFFLSSKPGDPPLVKPGQEIREDDMVCTIEVLHQRHPVKSGVRGRIKQICAQEGQMVEFKQALFLVEP